MPRIAVLMYILGALWLAGFGAAGWTAGAPLAVTCGTLGLLGFLAVAVVRIGAQQPRAGRPAPRRPRGA